MSTLKSIAIIFDKLIPLPEVEADFKNIANSDFFGLLPSFVLSNKKSIDHGGFIRLGNEKYLFDIDLYPESKHGAQIIVFTTDSSNFDDDLQFEDGSYKNDSHPIRKLVSLLKTNLRYYVMTLYLYDDYYVDVRELLEYFVLGDIENKQNHNYFEILDSPKFPLMVTL